MLAYFLGLGAAFLGLVLGSDGTFDALAAGTSAKVKRLHI